MATSGYREAMCGALTYTATTSGSASAGDVFYYTPDKNNGDYFMVTDWTSPDYWGKQRAPLRTAQEQYLLQQAQREEFHKYKRPEKKYSEAELKAELKAAMAEMKPKLKEALAKTTYRPPERKSKRRVFASTEPTPLTDMWRKADEWLSTVRIH
ncbi:MAG: hypothetical protein ACXADL_11950 [Candidatus Thorarchaeota archaeon]|jgi:hypothetical protein